MIPLVLIFFQEEIAEARRKRKLNILFLGMTRVAEYDCIGGLAKGRKRFDIVERRVRQDVDETNMNPLRWVRCCSCHDSILIVMVQC